MLRVNMLGTLILWGILGFCVGVGITSWLMVALRRRRLAGAGSKDRDPNDSLHRLTDIILYFVVKDNADRIVFGMPAEPFEIGKVEKLRPPPLSEDTEQFLKEMGEVRPSEIAAVSPLGASPTKEIPIYYRTNGKYYLHSKLPVQLLHHVILDFINHTAEGITLKEFGDEVAKISYSISMGDNYCYYVTIDSVDVAKKTMP